MMVRQDSSDHVPPSSLRGGFGHSLQTKRIPCSSTAQRINKLSLSWALQPRSATASPAPTVTRLPLCSSLAPPRTVLHVTFSFRSALRSPLPQRPPLAPRQLSKYAARQPTVSLQRRAFTRTLQPSGREQRGGQHLPPHRVGGGRAPGGPQRSRRGGGGLGRASHPTLLRTPRPTGRARVPRGATAALGEPEASRGGGGGASLEPTSFHPPQSRRSALLRPLKAPPPIPSLRAGADNCLFYPAPEPSSSSPRAGARDALTTLPPRHTQPPKLSRLPQTSPSPASLDPAQGRAGVCRWSLSGPGRRALTSGIPSAQRPGSCGKGGRAFLA